MTNVQDWIAINELKARYCRLLDTKQWDAWAELFTEDYELDVSQETQLPPIRGRQNVMDHVLQYVRDAVTAHQVHSPEITVDGDGAKVIWAMQDRVSVPERAFTGYGHYHETLVRQNGEWKISRLKLTRLRIDVDPV